MPKGILLAVLSVSLIWGWLREAAIFALAWAGLLRIGEILQAVRKNLVLPRDAAPGTGFALLQIMNPKTRGRSARHQAARVDPVDLVALLDLAFGCQSPSTPLWNMSSGTLRKRLNAILERLQLLAGGKPCFDLASFRPGGATWMLHTTENADMVRRRGRWLSARVMDIYLQEVLSISFIPSLQPSQRALIEELGDQFSAILRRVSFFYRSGIPEKAWRILLQKQP